MHKLLQSRFRKHILFLAVVQSLFGCTFTTIKPKEPRFNVEPSTIASNIGSLIATQEVKLNGSELNTEGQITFELAITIINPKNPPNKQEQFKGIGKRIAQLQKQALKDQNEYDIYKVIFLFEQIKGTVTNSNSVEFSYISSDL